MGKRWIHKSVAKTHGVSEDVVRRIYEVVQTSKKQGLLGGHMLDFLERHVGRRLVGPEYGVFREAKSHLAYNPEGGYGGPKPTGIAAVPSVRARADDPTYEKANRLAHHADAAIDDLLRKNEKTPWKILDGSNRGVIHAAADELCVAGDLYEEAGATIKAGTLRQRAKHARSGDHHQLVAYRSHLSKRGHLKKSTKRSHLTKQSKRSGGRPTSDILHQTERGYITIEPTGKTMSYVVWINGPTAAVRMHTIGMGLSNAFQRAKDKLG